MLCDPMEAFYNFCVASDRYKSLMDPSEPDDFPLLDEAIAEFRADYEGAAQTLTLDGMEEVGE